jgi:hypothetical protein
MKNQKTFFYFSIELFDYLYFRGRDYKLCTKLFKTFQDNVADEELIGQFVFGLLLDISQTLTSASKYQVDDEFLLSLNKRMIQVADKDILIFNQFITLIFDKIMVSYLTDGKDVS